MCQCIDRHRSNDKKCVIRKEDPGVGNGRNRDFLGKFPFQKILFYRES